MFASYLTPEEACEIRRCASKTIYRYSKNGALHSYDDKPAITTKTSQMWYKDGIPHREADKPAFITSYREESWSNGQIYHDGDFPALVSGSCIRKDWLTGKVDYLL